MHPIPDSITIGKAHARRFMLAYQHLFPPRKLKGKQSVRDFIQKVGCIQFDPLNVVGRNPDLVLQSRVRNYRSNWLQEMLYTKRVLWDGWDKMMSIYDINDWPSFSRYRTSVEGTYDDSTLNASPDILKAFRKHGPLSSIDIKNSEKVDWWWGTQASLAKTVMDVLFASGKIGIHHKIGTRRVFDLIERLLPEEIHTATDPHPTDEAYQDWHVFRRVGGLGLVHAGPSEFWGGIFGVRRTSDRVGVLERLAESGQLVRVNIKEMEGRTFYIRNMELPLLESVRRKSRARPRVALLGALDNLLWDRKLVSWIFDFDYVWEVYKPVDQRLYGYYVLPILYGDRFIGRVEPVFHKKTRECMIKGWWWEQGLAVDDGMKAALTECFREFIAYLGASGIFLGEAVKDDRSLDWLNSL